MTDIQIDPYRFRISQIHGAVEITFELDFDQNMERWINVDHYYPKYAAAIDELYALPVPLSVHSPILDRYAEIITGAFGVGVKIMAMTYDSRLVEQDWTSNFERKRDEW